MIATCDRGTVWSVQNTVPVEKVFWRNQHDTPDTSIAKNPDTEPRYLAFDTQHEQRARDGRFPCHES